MAERLNAERDAGKDRDTGEYRHVPDPPDSGSLKVAPSGSALLESRERWQRVLPGPVPAPGPVPDPADEAGEDAEQPGPRRAVADPRANLVESVRTGLDLAGRAGQGPPQRLFKAVVLR